GWPAGSADPASPITVTPPSYRRPSPGGGSRRPGPPPRRPDAEMGSPVMDVLVAVLGIGVVALAAALVVPAERHRRAGDAVPLETIVREALADRTAAERAAMSSAVEQLVRMNQETLEAERRLGATELEGTRTQIDGQVAEMRAELARLTGLLQA